MSQETEPDRQADTPSWKGVALMKRRILLVTGVAVLTAPTIALAGHTVALARHTAAGLPTVSIRVEGLKKTLLLSKRTTGELGDVRKGGTPPGACSGRSAAGVLDRATHGHWTGSWSAKYQALSVTGILGEKHSFSSSYYWSIWVNHKYASSGICGITPQSGDKLLFAVEPDKGTWYPTTLKAPRTTIVGHTFSVTLMGYGSSGAKPLAGVTIKGNDVKPATTNHRGVAHLTAGFAAKIVLRAAPHGYIRTEAVVHAH